MSDGVEPPAASAAAGLAFEIDLGDAAIWERELEPVALEVRIAAIRLRRAPCAK